MKIAVIAANGRSGSAFVDTALQAGHQVNAGVFGKSNLIATDNLKIFNCDATSQQDLANLIKGQDAVVSLIGHVKGSPPSVQTNAMRILVDVMKAQGIKRVVSLTGTGVRFPNDEITMTDRILNLSILLLDSNRVKDGIMHAKVLKDSGLDWTIIRVLKLQNVEPKPFKLTENGPTKPYVGRQEVAQAILQVLEQASFIKQAPIITKN